MYCNILLTGCDTINFEINRTGHSKSSFIEEGTEGGGHRKVNKNEKGEGGSCHVCTFAFFKKNDEIFKMKCYSYSPVFPVDYNGSMKY